ncbi:DUF1476 domain-containing protein [Candidatus Phycosocius spiralis]|uniref:Aldolase n=1 Tax=Candidatus Phycosocius spiralis TaxID=2815099 RepID=A0ABQ4PU83_9PROT|nr:DUF1476 domain-containing protein [Candidatus Phycosocius spiralis]GIU66585.1 hypothetical protein PsB1_0739 [Candidatus Phycosocius spiralis]
MSQFDKRKTAHEAKYAHDSELAFKITARRNKLLGTWAAELLGLTGEEAEAYAKSIVLADFEEAGDEDVYRKIKADFTAAQCEVSEHQIRREIERLLDVARQQLTAG